LKDCEAEMIKGRIKELNEKRRHELKGEFEKMASNGSEY